jgi:hypothetical protein
MSARQLRFVHPTRMLSIALFAVSFATFVAPRANAFVRVGPTIAQTAQCQPSWIPTFGAMPGVDGTINAMTVFNDGTGPALYVGGAFTHAGGLSTYVIAKWNGSVWSALPGLGGTVYSLAVFDDGSGPALYAGIPIGVAKWNGINWTPLANGPSGPVYSLARFDDGSGPCLYAGGTFSTVGGVQAGNIAKWNGSSWSSLGVGLGSGTFAPSVLALDVFDDGNGDALYVGGNFISAGAIPNHNFITKWDGSSWTALGAGMDERVNVLAVFDDGTGPALYAGGHFLNAGGIPASHIAKWDGSSWSALVGGPSGDVLVVKGFNDGSGRALYVGGQFTSTAGVATKNIAKWSGSNWSAVGSGPDARVNALAVFNDGGAPALYVGGAFSQVGGLLALGIARWKSSTWSTLGKKGVDRLVSALTVFDDGSGPALVAGGQFSSAGHIAASAIAKWNGSVWSPLGSGLAGSPPWVFALAVFDDGNGPALYAGGLFTTAGGVPVSNIAKWSGTSWSALGSGITGPPDSRVYALTVFDDGTGAALYAGGYFATAGGQAANNIARWDGSNWTAVGGGTSGSATIRALTVFDDGTGPALFVGGFFSAVGGVGAVNVAKWDGSNWTGLASATTATYYMPIVYALTGFDDGSGAALYAAGVFDTINGLTVNNVAKWNGSAWSALGSGIAGNPPPSYLTDVQALSVFDEGGGPRLFAKGDFTSAGGIPAGSIAKWDGTTWSALGQGLTLYFLTYGSALTVYDDSSGPALYVGGYFSSALDSGDTNLAKWGCAFVDSGATFCTTGTTSNGCLPTISSAGNASATAGSGFTLSINNLESHRMGVVFYGLHGQLASPWGAGGASLLCVKPPTQRLDPYDSGGSPGSCNGLISEDWNLFIANHAAALGQPFLGGETVWAQGWFRDPPSAKTTALSNGLVFAVAP